MSTTGWMLSDNPTNPAKARPKSKAKAATGIDGWIVSDSVKHPAKTMPSAPKSAPAAPKAKSKSPESYLSVQPQGKPPEGVYNMRGYDGRIVPVVYSKVEHARSSGFHFADQNTLQKYGTDSAHDPANKDKADQWMDKHPVMGVIPRFLQGVGTSLEEGLAGGDRIVSHLSGKRPVEALQLEAAKRGKEGPAVVAGEVGEQLAEFLVGEGEISSAVRGTALAGKAAQYTARAKELTNFLNKYPRVKAMVGLGTKAAIEASKAAGEQGAQAYVHSGGDVAQTKQAAKSGAVAGALAPLATGMVSKTNRFAQNILRHRFGVDEFATEKLIQEAGKANEVIDKEAEKIHASNVESIKKARDAERSANAARVPGTEVSHLRGEEVSRSAKLEHDDAVVRQQALAAKRQNLSDAFEKTREAVQKRLKNIRDAGRAYFGKAYGDLEKEGAGKQVSLGDLSDDSLKALEKVSGSEESTKTFKDIAERSLGTGNGPKIPSGYTEEDWNMLAKDEKKAAWDDFYQKNNVAPGVPLRDLNGYYSELGRVASSKSTPGDLRAAANAMREAIDKRIKETYGEELFKKNELVRSQYRRFAEGYLQYSGPVSSGSPVAQAIEAEDYYHATEPLIGQPGAVQKRIQGIVVGDPKEAANQFLGKEVAEKYTRAENGVMAAAEGKTTPAWRYRRQTHALIEHMRNLQQGLSKLESSSKKASEDVEKAEASLAKARGEARELAKPKLEPKPAPKTLTPTELQAAKKEVYLNFAHNLGKFGTWVAIGGMVGGASLFVRGLATGEGVEKALGEGAAGIAMGMVAPYMISKMLERPNVTEALTRLSKGDLEKLMKLPPDQRGPTEDLIRKMSEQALREGKIKSAPWLRVLGGTAVRKVNEKKPEAQAQTEDTQGTLQELKDMDTSLPGSSEPSQPESDEVTP